MEVSVNYDGNHFACINVSGQHVHLELIKCYVSVVFQLKKD